MVALLWTLFGVVSVVGLGVVYAALASQWPARTRPRRFLMQPRPRKPVVVGYGDSLTQASVSFDWLGALQTRNPDVVTVNAGVNGETAWKALQRIDSVLACTPDVVIVWVGTNDANTMTGELNRRTYMANLGLPQAPTPDVTHAALTAIVQRLSSTNAAVAIATIPPLGEDLTGDANAHVLAVNDVIAAVAREQHVTLLPFYDAVVALLEERKRTHPSRYAPLRHVQGMGHVVWMLPRRFWLHTSYDEIARLRGLHITPDTIHLTESAGILMTHLAEDFVRRVVRERPAGSGDAPLRDAIAHATTS